ncbi:hypothetical protein GCM10023317_10440 [Actinopolymorpha pittospori]
MCSTADIPNQPVDVGDNDLSAVDSLEVAVDGSAPGGSDLRVFDPQWIMGDVREAVGCTRSGRQGGSRGSTNSRHVAPSPQAGDVCVENYTCVTQVVHTSAARGLGIDQ